MPKHTRLSSSSHNRYGSSMSMSLTPAVNPNPNMYNQRLSIPDYYSVPSSSTTAPPIAQPDTYDTYTTAPPVSVPPVQQRASSGAWSAQDDQTLLQARAQGLNWAQIQATYFSNKTPNACRKRHERLMERKGADDWDNRRLERIAKEYMGMRKEIWSGLAARTGEKWNVVEAKVTFSFFFFFFSFFFLLSLFSSASVDGDTKHGNVHTYVLVTIMTKRLLIHLPLRVVHVQRTQEPAKRSTSSLETGTTGDQPGIGTRV